MQHDTVEPFLDNWTYIRTELHWLDRILSVAIAKKRKETKEIDRLAKSSADRVSSHWWKGLISLEGEAVYDSPAEMPRQRVSSGKTSYQQQMEAKLQASQHQTILGLPSLCSRLQLSLFEKNLLLIALAPEINRRYGRIYNYLQDTEQQGATGLPTVELILRLLCRNDAEWQTARLCLTNRSTLVQQGLIEVRSPCEEPLLSRCVKLADLLVDYLLASTPDLDSLEALLQPFQQSETRTKWLRQVGLTMTHAEQNPWSRLVLPERLLQSLQHLCDRLHWAEPLEALWKPHSLADLGGAAILTGSPGTGKTISAQAMAQRLNTSLFYADLKLLQPTDYQRLLEEITCVSPKVLLLKSAYLWLGRSASIARSDLHQLLEHRKDSLTLFSVDQPHAIQPYWRRELACVFNFPFPDQKSRLRLWQQVFPAEVMLAADVDWVALSDAKLTGGEIDRIARDALLATIAESPDTQAKPQLTMQHLLQAFRLNAHNQLPTRTKGAQ